MEAKIRLDQSGSPYLEIAFREPDMESSGVQEDAEKLFFTQLKNNGGVLHVYNSRNQAKLTKVLVVSNIEKRGAYKITDAPLPTPVRAAPPAPIPLAPQEVGLHLPVHENVPEVEPFVEALDVQTP